MKIIINRCFGGYGVSAEAITKCRALGAEWAQWPRSFLKGERSVEGGGPFDGPYEDGEKSRTCPHMIALVEQDPGLASGRYAALEVVEIPDDTPYEISDYDGQERVGPPISYWD